MLLFIIFSSLTVMQTPSYFPQVPSGDEVAVVEKLLAKQRCVRPLSSWARHYAYRTNSGNLLPYIIEVKLKRFSDGEEMPGVYREKALKNAIEIDDRKMDFRLALYNKHSGKFRIFYCGNNSKEDIKGFR